MVAGDVDWLGESVEATVGGRASGCVASPRRHDPSGVTLALVLSLVLFGLRGPDARRAAQRKGHRVESAMLEKSALNSTALPVLAMGLPVQGFFGQVSR